MEYSVPMMKVWEGSPQRGSGVEHFVNFRTKQGPKVKDLSNSSHRVLGRLLVAAMTNPNCFPMGDGQ